MSEHNLPWVSRPREFDDWGWIRDAAGNLAACARGDDGRKSHDQHRADGTDPYGEYAALIVNAVNSHNEAMAFLALASTSLWTLGDQAVAHEIDRFLGRVGGAGTP